VKQAVVPLQTYAPQLFVICPVQAPDPLQVPCDVSMSVPALHVAVPHAVVPLG